jgi:hypothetical protein
LPAPIYASIDSTISQIWLPLDACQAFEREFGLTWDSTYNLYLVNSSLHASLLARNAYVNFTIGTTAAGLQKTTISLPYAAFDMTAQSPYQGLADRSSYFPLRRAANSSQYTLGRTFMQEAYITVDYERAKFNVSQCVWPQNVGNATEIITITPAPSSENSGYSGASSGVIPSSTSKDKTKAAGLSGGAIGGIVAGSVIGVAALIGLATWFVRRDRGKKTRSAGDRRRIVAFQRLHFSHNNRHWRKGNHCLPQSRIRRINRIRGPQTITTPRIKSSKSHNHRIRR